MEEQLTFESGQAPEFWTLHSRSWTRNSDPKTLKCDHPCTHTIIRSGQPRYFTLSCGENPWCDVQEQIQRCDRSGNSRYCMCPLWISNNQAMVFFKPITALNFPPYIKSLSGWPLPHNALTLPWTFDPKPSPLYPTQFYLIAQPLTLSPLLLTLSPILLTLNP
jgi:hypothetical protein